MTIYTEKMQQTLLASALGNVKHIIMQGRGLMVLFISIHTYSHLSIIYYRVFIVCLLLSHHFS